MNDPKSSDGATNQSSSDEEVLMMLWLVSAAWTQTWVFGNTPQKFANLCNTSCGDIHVHVGICFAYDLVQDNAWEHEGSGRWENTHTHTHTHTSCRLKSEHIKALLLVTEIPPITHSATCFAHSALIKGLINIMHHLVVWRCPIWSCTPHWSPFPSQPWHPAGIKLASVLSKDRTWQHD